MIHEGFNKITPREMHTAAQKAETAVSGLRKNVLHVDELETRRRIIANQEGFTWRVTIGIRRFVRSSR